MPLSAGDRLGRYEILAPIGAGGMGEVYRAKDTELERDVAIKVLPEAVSHNPDRLERFRREAKAVARLAHPNILEIWDYGTEGDTTYSVTELLEGETLRERLEGGALGWRKATEIGAAIADGLGAAHEAGIVHRDVKPSNVFLTADGRVKVLDFGLARHEPAETGTGETAVPTMTRQTDPGTVMGTVGYMSPEQVRGETVDQRSDIFSLGCVLYEMVSGRQTFKGDTAVETMNAILKEEPEEVSSGGVVLPSELAGTIRRCLEKRPQSRFQSASDLAYNLRTISSASAPTTTKPALSLRKGVRPVVWLALAAAAAVGIVAGIALWAPWREAPQPPPEAGANRVAIAPLENRTGDPSLDALSVMAVDLMTHRLVENQIAETLHLRLTEAGGVPSEIGIGESSTEDRISELARSKRAGVVVSGAYYLEGDVLRLQARLTNPATGNVVYAIEPVIGDRAAAGEAIESLGERVLAAVAFYLDPVAKVAPIRPPSVYEAYRETMRGRENLAADVPRAIARWRRAAEIDPGYAEVRFLLASTLWNAQELDGAARELVAAEELTHRFTPYEWAWFRACKAVLNGNLVEARDASREMMELAPLVPFPRWLVGMFEIQLNRPREAIEVLESVDTSSIPPQLPMAWWPLIGLSDAHHMRGEYEQELLVAQKGVARGPNVLYLQFARARALGATGQLDGVDRVIDECLRVPARVTDQRFNVPTREWSQGRVMVEIAVELRAHGHPEESSQIAARAIEWFEARPTILSASPSDRTSLAFALRLVGRLQDSREELADLAQIHPEEVVHLGALGATTAVAGDREEALRIFEQLPHREHRDPNGSRAFWQAAITAQLGDRDRAMKLLRDALSQGYWHGSRLHCDPDLEPLWDNPEFQELIKPKG